MEFTKQIMKYFSPFLKTTKLNFFFIITNEVLKRATLLIIPIVTELIINDAISNKNITNFYEQVVVLIALTLASLLFTTFDYYIRTKTQVELTTKIKEKICMIIGSRKEKDKEKISLGATYERINNDVEELTSFIVNDIIKLILNILFTISIIIIMFSMNVYLSIAILVLFPLTAWINTIYSPLSEKCSSQIKSNVDKLNSHVELLYNSNTIIKLYLLSNFMRNISRTKLQSYKKSVMQEVHVNIIFDFLLLTGILNLGTILPNTLGIFFVYKHILSIGEITAFSLYCSRLWSPADFFINFPSSLARKKVAFSRIMDLNRIEIEKENDEPVNSLSDFETLDVKNLTFKYDDNSVISGLSLQIKNKERIAIIGSNGSGKSTFGKLLVKLVDPTSGTILYNGTSYAQISPAVLRSKIAYIPPKAFIFPFSIDENIYFNYDKNLLPSDLSVLDSLKETHTDKYSCESFSEGQKKLIELFRGLNKRADIYIFDEPLSYLDKENKEFIYNLIIKYTQNKTTLIITHDEKLIGKCDRSIILG